MKKILLLLLILSSSLLIAQPVSKPLWALSGSNLSPTGSYNLLLGSSNTIGWNSIPYLRINSGTLQLWTGSAWSAVSHSGTLIEYANTNLSNVNQVIARVNLGVYSTGAIDTYLGAKLDTTLATTALRTGWSLAKTRTDLIVQDTTNWNTAYSHTLLTNNPHSVTATQVGLGNVTNESKATMFTSPTFTGTIQLGLSNIYHSILETNELKAYNNTSATTLYLNWANAGNIAVGGNVQVGASNLISMNATSGAVTASSLALGGATIGTNALAVTGTAIISGNVGLGTTSMPMPNGSGQVIYSADYPRLILRNSTTGNTANVGAVMYLVGNNLWLENDQSGYNIYLNQIGAGNIILNQNNVAPFTSVGNGAVANTLYLKSGSIFVGGYISDPTSGNKFAVNGNEYINGTGTFTDNVSLASTKYLYQAGDATTAGSWRQTATTSGAWALQYKTNANFVNQVSSDSAGNVAVRGTITSDKFAYGSVYIDDTYPDSIDVTSSAKYYTVGAKQGARGKAWTSGGVLKNVTVQDSSMTVGVAGKYEVSYSWSFQTITGITNGTFNFYIFVNDVKQEKTGAKRLMSGTNDLGVGAVAPTVLSLAANDVLKMKVISPSDASNTVAFQYAIMHVKRIDN